MPFRVGCDTASASFVIFDRDAFQFIGKSAVDLKASLNEADENQDYPSDLNMFLDKKFVFKIRVTTYNMPHDFSTYSISKMTDDGALLEEFSKCRQLDLESHTGQWDDQDVDISITPRCRYFNNTD
ncbi:uncharacterized protein [Euphorbia lathyris]|uniref:uncharacterized protein n=1 Tax=Euphorbia lathyris TaxID=212925 RepID=UPI003313D188